MEIKKLQDILIKVLRAELTGMEPDGTLQEQLTPDVISALFALARRHDLAHIVSAALYRNGLVPDNGDEIMSVYRYEQMRYAYGQICGALDEASVPYIPLKGSVIRPYYPRESMRTSCDIDILVQEKDLNAAINALVQKGFECGKKNYHDVSLYSPNKIHLELHFNIQENMDVLDAILKDAWHYATPVEGCRYEFSKEFFMFHMFAHMSYHFLSGGCGIRPLMDIWIMKHNMGITYLQGEGLLKRAGIDTFAAEMTALADICFSGAPQDGFSDILLSYIFDGGVYGSFQNAITVKKERSKNTFRYSMQRLFLPYKDMVVLYPVLKRISILLPFCWVCRFFQMLFGGKAGTSISEIRAVSQISDEEIDTIKQIKTRLGL